jgi:hypothetical protein
MTLAFASAAHAVVTYDDSVTPDILFGAGNVNGDFTVDRANGVELGLRGKVRFPSPANVFNNNGDGTYTFKAGVFNGVENPQWNFEWAVNTNYDGSGGNLDAYTYKLEMDFDPGPGTNFLAWDHISYPTAAIPYAVPATPPFYDHSVGINATPNGGGTEAASAAAYAASLPLNNVAQNSWRYPFYDGAPFLFDANKTGSYEIRLTAYQGVTVVAQVSIKILVYVVDGLVTPDVIYGSGNANGSYTLDRANGVELGLRGKIRFPVSANVFNSNANGTYTFLAGVFNGVENPQWNFDWAVNTNYDGSGANLDAYTYQLEMDFDPGPGTNFLAWDQISYPTAAIPYAVPVTPPFYDHSIGTNATLNGGGTEAATEPAYAALLPANNVVQNSWRYPFYDGAPFLFDATKIGRYTLRLTAYDGLAVAAQVAAQIQVVKVATCTLDSQCDDGDPYNGAETCNLATNKCEFGTAIECLTDADCETDGLFCTYDTCNNLGECESAARDCAATDQSTIDFESPTYTAGTINGQDGWSSLGAAGSGCAVYDHAVASSAGTTGFGAQSLRISNAVTSGCFGDQTFSQSLPNQVGETTADDGGMSGGVRRTHFESQFDIASKVPGAQQPGLVMSTSADRGDGARMTYLRFEDSPTGLQIYFDDYQDAAPYGTAGNAAFSGPGCGVEDDFIETQVGTDLDRSVPHTIRETLDVLEGPRNDIVKIYIDGNLVHTGTSWEDYFRWCEATDVSRTVDARLFRTGGAAAPGTAGNGFLIDNLTLQSGDGSECNDACNEANDSCLTPVSTACTADANGCTDDVCDGSGSCTHPNNTAPCDDSLFCNGTDTCSGGTCGHSGDPCPGGGECNDSCNEGADNCAVAGGTACTPDANVCTNDTCNGSGACTHPNNTAPCDDGLFCNGTDTCGGGSCGHAGDPCAGGVECNNVCNEGADNCAVAGGTACTSDGSICTTDTCNGSGACTHPITAVCLELDPTLVQVRQQKPGRGNGSINVKGDFITGPPADVFDNANAITLGIADGLSLNSAHTWLPAECLLKGSGTIKCTSPDKNFKALFIPVKAQPGVFRLRARFKNLTIDAPFAAPVTVTLTHGSGPTTRAGQVSDCQATNAGIKCRQF